MTKLPARWKTLTNGEEFPFQESTMDEKRKVGRTRGRRRGERREEG